MPAPLTSGAPIVGSGDGSEPFLTGRVPNLQLDLLTGDFDDSRAEFDADGVRAVRHELLFRELVEKTRFPDTHVTDYDIFKNI